MGQSDNSQGGGNIETLMADMAAGRSEAFFRLLDVYRADLTKSVRWILRDLGRSDAAPSGSADLDYLVHTAALVVFDRASGWKPGAALPWVWAHRSIRSEIVRWLGHPRMAFDPGVHDAAAHTSHDAADLDLRSLAARDHRIADWLEQVEAVANERDQKVHLEYQIQKHLGDRSPALTVASLFRLSPSNVRQIDARVRRKLGPGLFQQPARAARRTNSSTLAKAV